MIKVLIIEDDLIKSDDVKSLITELGILESSIHTTNYVKDALDKLRLNHYNLVILDLNLPYYIDSDPIDSAGKTILQKLLDDERYITPSEIIGLTSFDNLKDEFEDRFKGIAFSLYNYELDNWREAIENRLMWLKKSIRQEQERENVTRSQNNITILIHGVMTEGYWQDNLAQYLKSNGHDVHTYKYRSFSPLKILLPITRKKQALHFKAWFDALLIKNPNSTFNIVGHSFGTFLSIYAMEKTNIDSLVKINNIIFLGSVIQRTYDFSRIKKKFVINRIINDCGVNDIPLIFSKACCWGLGHAGRVGFSSNQLIQNRFFNAGHSVFIDIPDYFKNHLIECLIEGKISEPQAITIPSWKTKFDAVIDNLSPIVSLVIISFLIWIFI
ncbi:MAG: alpha/beta fold hydrolase [Aeromonas sp.]